jgi:hypothetical protein
MNRLEAVTIIKNKLIECGIKLTEDDETLLKNLPSDEASKYLNSILNKHNTQHTTKTKMNRLQAVTIIKNKLIECGIKLTKDDEVLLNILPSAEASRYLDFILDKIKH